MLQQLLQQCERVCMEVGGVMLDGHGKHGVDAYSQFQNRLCDEQIRAFCHAHCDSQLRIGQLLPEVAHEVGHCTAKMQQLMWIQVPMTGDADDEGGACDALVSPEFVVH